MDYIILLPPLNNSTKITIKLKIKVKSIPFLHSIMTLNKITTSMIKK